MSGTYYGVKTVDDDALGGHEWAFVNLNGGGVVLLLIRSATARTIAEACTAARNLQAVGAPRLRMVRRLTLVS